MRHVGVPLGGVALFSEAAAGLLEGGGGEPVANIFVYGVPGGEWKLVLALTRASPQTEDLADLYTGTKADGSNVQFEGRGKCGNNVERYCWVGRLGLLDCDWRMRKKWSDGGSLLASREGCEKLAS